MKYILIFFLNIYLVASTFTQTNPEKTTITSFVSDLKVQVLSNEELIKKYFLINDKSTSDEKRNSAVSLLSAQFELLRQKLNNDCHQLEIISYDASLGIVKTYNLTYDADKGSAFFILCDDVIMTPVLIDNNKIVSITTYAKTGEGLKKFVIF
ncbi:MAG: hypothetical protein KDC79_07775 [Cyclobacteriaceae bacterium]|nr:hypothetical protein [Cyclobacteriaceae bacterium]